ncbi:MAG: hypothetical protein AAGJ38_02875 [Planctomycetota bacterium]
MDISFEVVPGIVTGFTLVDPVSDTDIGPISDGDTIDLSTTPDGTFTLRADTVEGFDGSVEFRIGGSDYRRVENVAPFALFGDAPTGQYDGGMLPAGKTDLIITPYSGKRAIGEAGTPVVLTVEIVGAAPIAATAIIPNPGDFDGSGKVDQADLNLVLNHWGQDMSLRGAPAGWVHDLPQGTVDQIEMNAVMRNWGATSSLALPAVAAGGGSSAPTSDRGASLRNTGHNQVQQVQQQTQQQQQHIQRQQTQQTQQRTQPRAQTQTASRTAYSPANRAVPGVQVNPWEELQVSPRLRLA